ncbi:hypothetical protein GOBAR_AA03906 [Gossypium barbadense]|uniref:Uncharacterized protein n=1 Tax=Gossypium barbadense TaxID=3634 RepID=A0A2P5YM22_GOSBA|nr:hypothetical protein GOBAR_AA03906 [Gossypium barbadense]
MAASCENIALLLVYCIESVVMRTGCGRGIRGLWRYGAVVVGVWGVADVGGDRGKWAPNARGARVWD